MKPGMEKREKADRPVKKTVLRNAKPMIQAFWRKGSVRSLMEVQTAPLAAATAAGKPSAQPMVTPVRPTPMATVRPFSIWARNTARETERGKEAILPGEGG